MKQCSYCGCINGNAAVRCRGCRTYFPGFAPRPEPDDSERRRVFFRSFARKVARNPVLIWFIVLGSFLAFGFLGPGLENQAYGSPLDLSRAAEPAGVFGSGGFFVSAVTGCAGFT